MRKKVIAGNWKLHKTIRESVDFAKKLKDEAIPQNAPEIILCPVYTALSAVSEVCLGSRLKIGAQDLYWEEKGAFTGQVSAALLSDAGCEHVIIGHSERRQYFSETDETVNKKIRAAVKQQLKPIVCCGEVLAEREAGKTERILDKQIKGAFKDIPESEAAECYIAYEPVWAIGTGKVATPDQAQDAHRFIRGLLEQLYSKDLADRMPILYGGSVKPENAGEILAKPDVDGALVGGASLDAGSLSKIIQASCEVNV